MNKKYLTYAAIALAAVILSDRIRALPVVGPKIPTV